MEFVIELKGAGGLSLKPTVTSSMRIEELKEKVAAVSGCEVEQVRLLYKGALLSDERTLADYAVPANAVIHVNISRAGAGTIGSARDASEQLDEQERLISNMMALPGVKQMLENPEFIRNMMNSNPRMREVFEKNPEFKAALKDDATMKLLSQTMTNPSMRKEMMRNMDRAMANIETMPGGWDALQRVYHAFQEPLMDSIIPEDKNPSSSSNNSSDGNSDNNNGPTNSAMPNPWQRKPQNQNPFANLGGLNLLGANSWGSPTPNPNPNPNPNPYASLFGNPYGLPNPFLNTSFANSNPNPFFNPTPIPTTTPTPAPPQEEEDYNVKYKDLLQELEEMGFTDRSANLAALIEADGELDKAITILFPDPNDTPKGDSS